jgi:hypothetical protein
MGRIVSAIGTADSEAFTQALLEALPDVYDKTSETSIRQLYRVLGTQLADVDSQVEALKYDNYLSISKVDETVTREDDVRDRLTEEGAFELVRIGFNPTNNVRTQNVSLTPVDTEIILEYIPTDITLISIYDYGDSEKQSVVTVTAFNALRNSITISNVPKASLYTVQYPETGDVAPISETFDLYKIPMTEGYGYGYGYGGNHIVQLSNANVVYDSEKVTLAGSNLGTFTRGLDYTFDYIKGILSTIPGGQIELNLSTFFHNLTVEYKYRADFSKDTIVEFHTQVFNEYATLTDQFEVEVKNSPLSDVFRVFNTSTREVYTVDSFSRNRIKFSGGLAPKQTDKQLVEGFLRQVILDGVKFDSSVSVTYPNGSLAEQHPLIAVSDIRTETAYIKVIEANRDEPQSFYTIGASAETVGAVLRTGHPRTLRQSQIKLVPNVDFIFIRGNGTVTISLLASGLQKIGHNNLYASLIKKLPPTGFELNLDPDETKSEYRAKCKENVVFEETRIFDKVVPLTKLQRWVSEGQEADVVAEGFVIVSNAEGTLVYEEGADYEIDFANRRLSIIEGGKLQIGNFITVFYGDPQQFFINYTFMEEGVAVDYDWSRNSINWSPSFKDTLIQQIELLTPKTN